jgi:hypothetical protein
MASHTTWHVGHPTEAPSLETIVLRPIPTKNSDSQIVRSTGSQIHMQAPGTFPMNMGILAAYGPPGPPGPPAAERAHPYQHAQPTGPTFQGQGMPMAVVIHHQMMHTSTWPQSRLMLLGTCNNVPVVQFHHKPGEPGYWHGSWELRGNPKEFWIYWHYSGMQSKVPSWPSVYTAIDGTDSFRRGHAEWVEVLTPLR